MLDEFEWRSPGRQMRAGPAPEVRPQPARVAEQMRRALSIQATMKEEGWSLRKTASFLGMAAERAYLLLKLTKLAPDIQEQLLAMTTTTASCPVTERKLRAFVVDEPDFGRQRELFAKVVAGELQVTSQGPRLRNRRPTSSANAAAPGSGQ